MAAEFKWVVDEEEPFGSDTFHMETDHGHVFYTGSEHPGGYDIDFPLSGSESLDAGGKACAERDYMEYVRPLEELCMRMAERGIWYPCFEGGESSYFPESAVNSQFCPKGVRFVAVSRERAVPMSVWDGVRECVRDEQGIPALGYRDTIDVISEAIDKGASADGKYAVAYGGRRFEFGKGDVLDVDGMMVDSGNATKPHVRVPKERQERETIEIDAPGTSRELDHPDS